MAEKLTVLDAFRGGKLTLPPGYTLEYGADVLLLRRNDASVAAAFSARGVSRAEVERVAAEDHLRHGKTSA